MLLGHLMQSGEQVRVDCLALPLGQVQSHRQEWGHTLISLAQASCHQWRKGKENSKTSMLICMAECLL